MFYYFEFVFIRGKTKPLGTQPMVPKDINNDMKIVLGWFHS